MKLGYDTKSKDPTYYIQMGLRIGKKTTTKNIKKIGKHSELLEITDDPLTYAKAQVAKYNEEAKKNNKANMEVQLDFAEKVSHSKKLVSESTLKDVGYLYLQKLYRQLEIEKFFSEKTSSRKYTFSPDLVNRFLTYSRILNPDSKLGTLEKINRFYEEPSFSYQHIMRTMDLMAENYNDYMAFLFKASNKIVKRNTAVCYYDCTNYYSETESKDPEYTDPVTGEVTTGLRQYGFSKEHKPNPLVEMGLFMDSNGIPISMCIAPGNTNEQTTAIPLEKELLKMFGEKKNKFIYCADAGLGSYHIRNFNSMGGRAFVITQSVKKLSDVLKQAVFNDFDYKLLSNDSPVSLEYMQNFNVDKNDKACVDLYNDRAYKILDAPTLIDVGLQEEKQLKNGKIKKVKVKGSLKQYVIITFSRKSREYQRHIRNQQIERAKKILETLSPDEYKKGPNDVTRFITKKNPNSKDEYTIDYDKIAEEEKYDGFYAIATNLDDDAKEIFKINAQRYKIEDCFRILKTDFVSRPYYHRTRAHIIAHFMICYTALLIYRLLEVKLNSFDRDLHFSSRNIIETLQSMKIANIGGAHYAAQYTGSLTLKALEGCFNMGLDYKYFTRASLNAKCRKKF